MPWVRLDDHLDEHPKIAQLDDHAFALFICGLAYCNRNLTDGFIPNMVGLGQLRYCDGDTLPAIRQLEAVGLWEECAGGWRVHDYALYQPSKAQVLAERESGKRRAAASYSQKQSLRSSPEETAKKQRIFGDSSGDPVPVPVPVPESRALFPEPDTTKDNGLPTAPRKKPRGNGSVNAPTWEAYRESYVNTYHAEPVRNAKVNGQISQIVQRLGAEDAPKVAAWFLSHRGAWYVQQGHCVGALLRDCEKLHTEWLNGATLHRRDVDEIDRTSADQAMWKRIEQRHETQRGGQT